LSKITLIEEKYTSKWFCSDNKKNKSTFSNDESHHFSDSANFKMWYYF
jgi:hypothetical protein